MLEPSGVPLWVCQPLPNLFSLRGVCYNSICGNYALRYLDAQLLDVIANTKES